MTNTHFVITGLDPVIHEAPERAEAFDGLPDPCRIYPTWAL